MSKSRWVQTSSYRAEPFSDAELAAGVRMPTPEERARRAAERLDDALVTCRLVSATVTAGGRT